MPARFGVTRTTSNARSGIPDSTARAVALPRVSFRNPSDWSVYGNDVVIDNTGNSTTYTEVSGTYNNSSLTGYSGSSRRYSGSTGAKAEWTLVSPKPDTYAVYIYKVVHSNSDTHAKITATHKNGSAVNYVDYTSGSSGWVYLGTYSFSGQSGYSITNERSNGNLRADAAVFIQQ